MEPGGFDSESDAMPVVRWSTLRILGILIWACAVGMAIALAFWLSCYHQSDITKFWGQIAMVVLGVLAIGVLVISRPTPARRTEHHVDRTDHRPLRITADGHGPTTRGV